MPRKIVTPAANQQTGMQGARPQNPGPKGPSRAPVSNRPSSTGKGGTASHGHEAYKK